jgi:hypothetical protein
MLTSPEVDGFELLVVSQPCGAEFAARAAVFDAAEWGGQVN